MRLKYHRGAPENTSARDREVVQEEGTEQGFTDVQAGFLEGGGSTV